MAFPIGAVALGATALGGLVSAGGSLMQGAAQKKMYDYQAGVAQINKKIALQNSDYAKQVGEVQAQQSGMKSRFQAGQIKTAQAASNLDVNSGSAKDVQESQAELGQHDQAIIRSDAAKKAYGYQVEATQQTAQSQIDTFAGKNSQTAGEIGAVSSILGASSSVSSKWLQGQSSGIWGGSDSGAPLIYGPGY